MTNLSLVSPKSKHILFHVVKAYKRLASKAFIACQCAAIYISRLHFNSASSTRCVRQAPWRRHSATSLACVLRWPRKLRWDSTAAKHQNQRQDQLVHQTGLRGTSTRGTSTSVYVEGILLFLFIVIYISTSRSIGSSKTRIC